LLRKAIKEGVVSKGRPAKRSREERLSLGSKRTENEHVMIVGSG
jgi:hypothetical protein